MGGRANGYKRYRELSVMYQDCLLEIGCEELPTASLQPIVLALSQQLQNQLSTAELSFSQVESFVTPRRIAVIIHELADCQPQRTVEQLGPPISMAYGKDGQPTAACMGFARTCGIEVSQLIIKDTAKGQRVAYIYQQTGMRTEALLPHIVQKALSQLPIAKPMRWANHSFTFLRPVHWVILLYGDHCVDTEILGARSQPFTYGHRFLHPQKIAINLASQYVPSLMTPGFVIAGFDDRRTRIQELIRDSLKPHEQAVIDQELLDEVTALVEWPVALRGHFKHEFLSVPKEVLIASMQTHQKCFPVMNDQQQLQPTFIVISNLVSKDPQAVVSGNERVINARLKDAAFFYTKDCQHPLLELAPKLHHVTFQQQLGSLAQKTERLVQLSLLIARQIGADITLTSEAAAMAKCDLLSEMVGEFPQLQGVMGYYYALNDGYSEKCALAIKQHYRPRFAKDQLPDDLEGCALALADRIDTLVGILGINQAPTGDKDPFGLRRLALGIGRILVEKSLAIDLWELLLAAQQNFRGTVTLPNHLVVEETFQFILQRLKSWYLERAVSIDVFNAVAACRPTILLDFDQRISAIMAFKHMPEVQSLAAANKRVSNILKKQANEIPQAVNDQLLILPAEQVLAKLLKQHKQAIQALCQQRNYSAALTQLAIFKPAVDDFFDQVMVMVEDLDIRQNRLALLNQLRQLLTLIADIALLQ